MKLIGSLVMLGSVMCLLLTVQQSGIKQHAMFCKMAQDYIEADTGLAGFQDALAAWKKFQIEDGCKPAN